MCLQFILYGAACVHACMQRMKANPSLPPTEQKVVAIPDVRTFEAYEGDYIFMACDGK